MSRSVTLTGMVLSSMPVGEYDRRIVILTKERGKISGFARGARRPKSALHGTTNPFCFGTFELYERRDSRSITRASIQNFFPEIREDLVKAGYGFYFLEAADYFTVENEPAGSQLKLLYQTLRALNAKSLSPRLVRRIYELKSLVYCGVYPDFFHCMDCGKKENLIVFSPRRGGMLCSSCAGSHPGRQLSESALYALQVIVTSPVEKLYTFTVTDPVLRELEAVMDQSMRLCTDREFRSLDFLNKITEGGQFFRPV